MKKLFLALAILFLVAGVSYGAVAVLDSGTYEGEATAINMGNGITGSLSGSTYTIEAGTAAITGGTIDGATIDDSVIGGTTPAAGDFTTIGATGAITGDSTLQLDGTLTMGDGSETDETVLFDGNAQDFYISIDDSADDLLIGVGSVVGTTPAIGVDENQDVTMSQELTVTDALHVYSELETSDETVTCVGDAGTADPDVVTSYIVTDGGADTNEDTVGLADGSAGEIKIFVYMTETDAGDSANVTPTNGAFTDILFEDPGDGCIMVFDGTNWTIVANNGGTITP